MAGIERRLVHALREKKIALVTVESCTGGGIADRLTRVPGSSEVFWGALVTYQVRAKARMLGIPARALKRPVSRAVAAAMSRAGFRLALDRGSAGSSKVVSVSTTGVAGPRGGTAREPVGLCYIGIVSNHLGGRARVVVVRPSRARLTRSAQKRRFAERALQEALREVLRFSPLVSSKRPN